MTSLMTHPTQTNTQENMASTTTVLPLERRTIDLEQNGVQKKVPALHKGWARKRPWMLYEAPPPKEDLAIPGAKDLWSERTDFVVDDLDFLLSLEHYKFWSQLCYDDSIHLILGQLLQRLPRDHDLFWNECEDPEIRMKVTDVLHKTFLVFVRLSTHKESSTDFITPDVFGSLIYDYFLLDVPRMFDIAALFHERNPKIVDKMIANAFERQPKYERDLRGEIDTIAEAFDTLTDRTENFIKASHLESPEVVREFADMTSYVVDCAAVIRSFLTVYPPAARLFADVQFHSTVAAFYENVVVPLMHFTIRERDIGCLAADAFDLAVLRLQMSRDCLVDVMRALIHRTCIQPLMDAGSDPTTASENYFDIITSCLDTPHMLADYDSKNSVRDDIDVFNQSGVELDPERVQFILDGVHAIKVSGSSGSTKNRVVPKGEKSKGEKVKSASADLPMDGAGALPVNANLEAKISQVKDVFPDLGDGFLVMCLEYFDDAEKVINSLLEENLPPHLIEVDRQTPQQPPSALAAPPADPVIPPEDDLDDLDDLDRSRLHRGKRRIAKNANALLNDKRDLADMKERFSALGIVSDEVIETGLNPEYDDEYDDTYDDTIIGEKEPDALDELTERRPFVLPQALGGGHVARAKVVVEEDEDDEEDKPRDEFVQNPAELRERAERRRQEKMARRTRNHQRQAEGPNRDVVGRAKGQGQDKQVLINRARKNANKGKAQRAGAERKQAKGMF